MLAVLIAIGWFAGWFHETNGWFVFILFVLSLNEK